ncbi:MAG TPA: ABC transporter permease subunit [Petrotogaceae bacterium]|nr:ABC transporter permease subunit [Petrotogaceae bacterium]
MASIEKKNYFLRHLFLILFTVIVLFPLLWVVLTSIRRDNAAFSPKMFSSRLTMRNYTTLLFPSPNAPEIIKEMNSSTAYIGKYKQYSTEKAQKATATLITDLKNFIDKSNTELEDISIQYTQAFELFDQKVLSRILKDINDLYHKDRKILEDDINSLDKQFQAMNIKKPDTSNLQNSVAAYTVLREEAVRTLFSSGLDTKSPYFIETEKLIYSIPIKITLWKIRIYNKWLAQEPKVQNIYESINTLSESWQSVESEMKKLSEEIEALKSENFGSYLQELTEKEAELAGLRSEIVMLENQKNSLNTEMFTKQNQIKTVSDIISPEQQRLKAAYDLLKKADITSPPQENMLWPENLDEKTQNLYSVIGEIEKSIGLVLEDISAVGSFGDNTFKSVLLNYKEIYEYILSSFDSIVQRRDEELVHPAFTAIESSSMKIYVSVSQLHNITSSYVTLLEKTSQADSTLVTIKNKEALLQQNLELLDIENSDKKQFNEKITYLPNMIVLYNLAQQDIKTMNQASSYAKTIEDEKFYPGLPTNLKKYFLFKFQDRMTESVEKFNTAKQKLSVMFSSISQQSDILMNDLPSYMKLNYGANVAEITPVEKMLEIYQSSYESANADMARASRIVSDLADDSPYGEIKSKMRSIDKNIYNIQKDWEKAIRKPFLRWVLNSVLVALITSLLTVAMTSVAAYPFSRMRFKGRNQGLLFLMIIQMFPAVMYMVSMYGILKFVGDYVPFIGLDTMGGLIFIYLGGIAYNMWLFKGYYDTIPDSLEESAMIDGATRFQTFIKIVLPLCLPIIAVVTILTFMGNFNEFVLAKIILQSEDKFTYAVGLQSFTAANGPFETEWGIFTAAALMGAVPMMTIFLLMQKWIVGGLTQGSVKG